ncbi:hypothetical protein A3C98_03755 [Candidatus Roizmanbacteria bacterium RIFCSPHIGHO2_02_FULL_37_15]|uniref:alpha-L-fucosidase n=1 Tax=Candidatus Roizmanbacteria bacterium RIFCSPLOWO2_01_FULL_37_16 TaxID=1802058 RepID=A0A1F7IKM4_9BACT|nr:MAG: hypothetical protein A2859_04975 [Candidatus Roizmanbacteria bacterium RIFCSPHIGHO2_01_FULL_37_16b]OGK20482.1 MAG: hypothetical protein A3C98_03755 [Candidatus Roizmanbacteria bacterium RIFCSPHIGHO2_02_FULL_37_15]OGK31749.1 MAG: hypothetical protein A3F57_00165 [Candidatus Roizmanbacteria bacterium RIFCSPHIGHO2_12_FULL_36_11]OGK43909.1 MAG: hypothetical protein A3B40_03800 [Candidatus Roizmanbacteria bacterium RIFCSPLOWO2_01_FULL_37_16]OGK55834.1 MAG: hypothetical protein A3I50_03405 [C
MNTLIKALGENRAKRDESLSHHTTLGIGGKADVFFKRGIKIITKKTFYMSLSSKRNITLSENKLTWWKKAKFGMFIHWGLYSYLGGIWKSKKTNYYSEWIMNTLDIPDSEYSKVADKFNPIKFDPYKWVKTAKLGGMKYLIFTAKHHEGFSMFDSKLTDYNIVKASPYKHDVVSELSQACKKEGLKFGVYYSLLDWHRTKSPGTFGSLFEKSDKYFKFVKGQIRELLTNYGDISVLFFDGDWMLTWNKNKGRELEKLIRKLQPNIIINDRIGKRPYTYYVPIIKSIFLQKPNIGDYSTIEQAVPFFKQSFNWESNITINDSWGYKKFDNNWKSASKIISIYEKALRFKGNLLLNIGPDGDGNIPVSSIKILKEIGKRMSES